MTVTYKSPSKKPSADVVAASINNPVPLKDATVLHQRVKGTSNGSVYTVVALGAFLAVAVRLKSINSVSIRVEFNNIAHTGVKDEITSVLESVNIVNKGDYLSGHFEVPSLVLGCATVGSILGALMAVEQLTVVQNFAEVINHA